MSITLNSVSYTYAPGTPYASCALEDISLTIETGDFVGIMGKTGCGKSTLLQLIAGLLSPDHGTILIDGKDINEKSYKKDELRKKIGVVFQNPERQLFETTVERDVAFGLKHFGWSKDKIQSSVKKALTTMGFVYEKIKEKSPLEFSGGEKRRIAIAGILAAEPEILILDEPIAGLDPMGREAFLQLLRNLNQSGTTILMISHDANALAEYAKTILILQQGKILQSGPTRKIFADIQMLNQYGIGVGEVRECAELFRRRGYPVPEDTIAYEDLLQQMLTIGKHQNECAV